MRRKLVSPVRRGFWKVLGYLPDSLRAPLVRSKFEVDYDLPSELTFKVADTEDEVESALKLVHDSYVELGYITPHQTQMRFTKYHAHPNAMILVAKWNDEVIGTLTIVPDSHFGLPVDSAWDMGKYRLNGKKIAEISSLTIKKGFRMGSGKLLLPLCKMMYFICKEHLKLDGVVAAMTAEVEPFYTDILLFERVCGSSQKEYAAVKGNVSSCCFLHLNDETEIRGKEIYSSKPDKRNLFKFFKETETKNIQFPQMKGCIQAYLIKQNLSKARILEKEPALAAGFEESDKLILLNYDAAKVYAKNYGVSEAISSNTLGRIRFDINSLAWAFVTPSEKPVECKISNISEQGVGITLRAPAHELRNGSVIVMVCQLGDRSFHMALEIKWLKNQLELGCQIVSKIPDWDKVIQGMLKEIEVEKSAA